MKTIVNKLRIAFLLGFVAIGLTVFAQGKADYEKLSISTQMFLDEMAGKITFGPDLQKGTKAPDLRLVEGNKPYKRPIASPDTIDDIVYISGTIRVTGDNQIAALENLGVKVMCKFDNGLLTANIPVQMIEKIASLDGVLRINVAELMEEETDLARQATNVDDVLTFSQDAALAGLKEKYDGSGVILAIIDNGIDFQHIAFKDKNGNPRIKRAYRYNGSTATEYTGSGSLPTADATNTDHGTHTSSIAGGSSVIVNGTNITVTDDHSSATYGGMAPGTDLYLAGIYGLNDVYLLNAFNKIVEYADAQNKPLVISNSWSNPHGPRDGNYDDDIADVVNQYFGESHPNRICLFASSNRAGNADPNEGGGLYASGTSSSANPLGSLLRFHYYSNADNGNYYDGTILDAWARSTNVSGLACMVYVIDISTGEVLESVTVTPPSYGTSTTVSGLSDYYKGTLTAYWGTNSKSQKKQIRLVASAFDAVNYTHDETTNFYSTPYTLAVEVYPTSGSSIIDMWAGTKGYFSNFVTTAGHNWVLGSDDVSVSDYAVLPEVVSVGSYVTRAGYGDNSVGDISEFSGYIAEGAGPTGMKQPCITAPGEVIISAFNHSATSHGTIVVDNSTNPYGMAQGTSMATPAAAGIVALWLQVANECGQQLSLSEVKSIMQETAIRDSWVTSGSNASHFGNGKIDALAGVEYILRKYGAPRIIANPTEVTFEGSPGKTFTKTVAVTGKMLNQGITATLNDPSGVFSINTTNLGNGGDLVITYSPTDIGDHSATVTLSSDGAESVVITITGSSRDVTDAIICDANGVNQYLPVYGYYYDEAQVNQMLYPVGKLEDKGMEGNKISKITFYPTTSNNHSGINFYYNSAKGNGTVTVKLANMPSNTSGYTNRNAVRKDADFVTVKTITMPSTAQTDLTEWVFENLDNDFIYEGGDLLIEVVTEAGGYGYTYFAGEAQSTYTGMYSYGSTARGQMFLPKVQFEWESTTPITAGTVSPSDLTFTDIPIDRTSNQAVIVTNTGNQAFTPVIDTTNLPAEFTVTGTGVVLPHHTLDLTVAYHPTDEGPHSGSFTVTIGDQTYTVTVTGNGIVVNNTLYSDEVTVPVYKTNIEILPAYTLEELQNDMTHEIPANMSNTDVSIKVTRDDAITRYDIYHNKGSKLSDQNWATGGLNNAVSYASVNTDSYVYLPYAKDEDLTSWVQQPEVAMESNQNSMWIELNDYVPVEGTSTWYVPVVVANGVTSTGNTYGAPIRSSRLSSVTSVVNYDQSTIRTDQTTGAQYYYMTAEVVMHCIAPQVDEDAGYHYECYLARAWRVWTPYVVGVGAGEPTETFLGEVQLDGYEDDAKIGNKDFQLTPTGWSLDEPTFCTPAGSTPMFVSRFYFKRVDDRKRPNRAGEGGGGAGAPGDGPTPPQNHTGVAEFNVDKDVVSVTYVNTLGMTSSTPFNGVNIIVTRYSDGSVSTTKVLK